MGKTSQEELIIKWSPVFEHHIVHITNKKMKLYMAEYADHHTHIENIKATTTLKIDEKCFSTLPFALSILSRINFENKNFAIADYPLHEDFQINDYHEEITIEKSKTIFGARIIDFNSQKAFDDEQKLIDKIVYFINTKFEDYNTLIAYNLASELNATEDKISCIFRIGFLDI